MSVLLVPIAEINANFFGYKGNQIQETKSFGLQMFLISEIYIIFLFWIAFRCLSGEKSWQNNRIFSQSRTKDCEKRFRARKWSKLFIQTALFRPLRRARQPRFPFRFAESFVDIQCRGPCGGQVSYCDVRVHPVLHKCRHDQTRRGRRGLNVQRALSQTVAH